MEEIRFQRALIIGATGMIGAHATRACLAHGIAVRALVRHGSDRSLLEKIAGATPPLGLRGLSFATGDLGDPSSLASAREECDLVIHAAAPYPRKHFGKGAFLQAAQTGMRNFLNAMRDGISSSSSSGPPASRVVYVSSSTTIGLRADASRLANEEDQRRAPDRSPYFSVKFLLEDLAMQAAAEGLPIVVVNPTLCVDEYDDHRTTAMLLIPLAQGKVPAYLKGSLNAVATRDVGEGIVLAAGQGRPGRRYILGGENLETRDLLARCARAAGAKAPRIAIPMPLAETLSMATETIAHVTRTAPLFPMSGVRMSKWSQPFSIARAQTELGYQPTSLDDAIDRAYAWYRMRGWM